MREFTTPHAETNKRPESGNHLRRLGASTLATLAFLNLSPQSVNLQAYPSSETIVNTSYSADTSDNVLVAIGDSYLTGINEKSATDTACGRSSDNPLTRLAELLKQEKGATNVSCAGATIEEILEGKWPDEPLQLEALSDKTRYVVVSAGINDVGIGPTIETCFANGCNKDSAIYQQIQTNFGSQKFQDRLQDLYEQIMQKAPNATVVVLKYPRLLASEPFIEIAARIMVGNDVVDISVMAIDTINDSIQRSVEKMDSDYLSAISTNLGHHFYPNGKWAVLHPTPEGSRMLGRQIASELYKGSMLPPQFFDDHQPTLAREELREPKSGILCSS